MKASLVSFQLVHVSVLTVDFNPGQPRFVNHPAFVAAVCLCLLTDFIERKDG